MFFRKIYEDNVIKSQLCENVFDNVLKFKTKQFPTPFNVQILSISNTCVTLSDGKHSMIVKLSSKYNYLSELSILKLYDVVTIFEIKRISQYDLFVDNISVNKSVQVHVKI